ncbi:MAG: hypothetical protein ABI232_00825 [Jatrophihabitantaceae bacterium]
MSKARALARAEREAVAAERAARLHVQHEREAAERAKAARRALVWRRVRLWQRGASHRHTEVRAALASLVLVLLVLAYLFTGSFTAVFGTALILLIASPLLLKLSFDRSHK